jgi:hypothetical protein
MSKKPQSFGAEIHPERREAPEAPLKHHRRKPKKKTKARHTKRSKPRG